MEPESKKAEPWDGVERRTKQLPVGPTAFNIAKRAVYAGKTGVDESDMRAGDLVNTDLRTRIDGILDLANRDEAKPDSEQADATVIPTTNQVAKLAETGKPELTPEQAYLAKFKTRFDSLPQLHQGIEWADVEKSLQKDPEQLRKLQILDEKGHRMNVFAEENGEFVFVSGWSDYNTVSPEHRNIAYDLEGQKLAEKRGHKPTGNAVDIIKSIGAEEADPKFHTQLIRATNVNGWAWLKTDAATRKSGYAFYGYRYGISTGNAFSYGGNSSFRAALRVKKA